VRVSLLPKNSAVRVRACVRAAGERLRSWGNPVRAIKDLKADLGDQLFMRTTHITRLTRADKLLLIGAKSEQCMFRRSGPRHIHTLAISRATWEVIRSCRKHKEAPPHRAIPTTLAVRSPGVALGCVARR
jgi:hypothetical protein